MEGLWTRVGLRVWAVAVLLFLFLPIVTVVMFAFDKVSIETFPIHRWTLHWFSVAWHDERVRRALYLSLKAAVAATAISLVLGTMAASVVRQFRFFGRKAVSLLLVLPLCLPAIVSGISLNSAFRLSGIGLSIYTIIIGQATFCIVVVYNNVLARLRRTPGSFYEASADLGANGLQTFRFVTLPVLSTAILAGGLLAFGLSFDEVIVTTFTAGAKSTLPLWIFGAIRFGRQLPQVNVVVSFVLLLSIVPVGIAARLTGGGRLTGATTAARPDRGSRTALTVATPPLERQI